MLETLDDCGATVKLDDDSMTEKPACGSVGEAIGENSDEMTFTAAINKYIEYLLKLSPDKEYYYTGTLALYLTLVARITGNKKLNEIDHDIAVKVLVTLRKIPPNLNRNREFKEKSINEMSSRPVPLTV